MTEVELAESPAVEPTSEAVETLVGYWSEIVPRNRKTLKAVRTVAEMFATYGGLERRHVLQFRDARLKQVSARTVAKEIALLSAGSRRRRAAFDQSGFADQDAGAASKW